jgi:hypothetical protein
MIADHEQRIAALSSELERLLAARVWRLGDVVRHRPPESQVRGVYLLSSPTRALAVTYAGRTKTKTIHGRLCDHRNLTTGSDLRGMLSRWPDYPQVPDDYGVRWLEISDAQQRGALELFAIAVLAPLFNRP